MLDIAWPELMVIGAVALVAIGPKDLPKVMHTLGQWAGKARSLAHDLQRSFDQLTYEAEIAEKLKAKAANEGSSPLAPEMKPIDPMPLDPNLSEVPSRSAGPIPDPAQPPSKSS